MPEVSVREGREEEYLGCDDGEEELGEEEAMER